MSGFAPLVRRDEGKEVEIPRDFFGLNQGLFSTAVFAPRRSNLRLTARRTAFLSQICRVRTAIFGKTEKSPTLSYCDVGLCAVLFAIFFEKLFLLGRNFASAIDLINILC